MHSPYIITQKMAVCIILLILPLLVGLASYYGTREWINIFDTIDKPTFTPPRKLFPIAWMILYLLMGIAAALAFYNTRTFPEKVLILLFFSVQLLLNYSWSTIFFKYQHFYQALFILIMMLAFIIAVTVVFAFQSKLSAVLMIPLILWVGFAGYLNYMIALMN